MILQDVISDCLLIQVSPSNCCSFFFRCIQQINKANRGELTPEELKERQVRPSSFVFIDCFRRDSVFQLVRSPLFCRTRLCMILKYRTF